MVAEYKYLGVLIDDSGKFDVQINRKKAIENSMMYQVKMSWSNEMPGQSRYIIWQSLVHSRFAYAADLLMNFTQNTKLWYQDLLYRLLKALMQIHSNPKKEDLFRVCLGMSIDEYTDGLSMQALLRLKPPERRTEDENKQLDEWLEKKKESWTKLKKILYSEA